MVTQKFVEIQMFIINVSEINQRMLQVPNIYYRIIGGQNPVFPLLVGKKNPVEFVFRKTADDTHVHPKKLLLWLHQEQALTPTHPNT